MTDYEYIYQQMKKAHYSRKEGNVWNTKMR